jgi:hypothetical protein
MGLAMKLSLRSVLRGFASKKFRPEIPALVRSERWALELQPSRVGVMESKGWYHYKLTKSSTKHES